MNFHPYTTAWRAHYFRICVLYLGPNLAHWRKWKARGLDPLALNAMQALRKWAGMDPIDPILTPKWRSGFGHFEERVAAIGSTYQEGCLNRQQAA